jgi:aminoglycoside phosphotransferase (APT) family kinase protein
LPQGAESARLVERLAAYRTGECTPALLHGDFWPGNLLWLDGRRSGVLDWEDAALGAPVSDVACCRAELNAMFDQAASDRFT